MGHSQEARQLRFSLSKLASFLPNEVSINLTALATSVSFEHLGLAGAIVRNVTVSILTLHITKNINGNELENTVNWYLSNENL